MLRVKKIKAGYDQVPVLFDVSFDISVGELVSIVGSNGAGKSTILRTLSGIIKPMAGEIEFMGERIDTLPSHKIVQKGIAHVPEGRHVFGKMSILDNLLLGAYTVKSDTIDKTLREVYEIFPRLKERAHQKAETLSGGEQQMLAIARGLMSCPKLLLVDEMSLGLMPILVDKVLHILKEISRRGMTVLLVEQKVQEALEIADRGYVLQTGRIVLRGTGEELLNSDLVKKAYMGI
ncbi:amino acid/amide ABC transporter ATP-binding protein 2, HAAT family [Geosporobacter subterraneus DSM 17957]|uniref:Amino acid/amide ABC transporter ATP-binding protein 2, HAAT family n=1 Tax=Geosporobacter subterraneus DSM 17957 TaxID=1121919 RepID=A0A1M6D461_9FIRM|nr:ABC transporter ATP-binding protein [Geosporobacter subterraneus]SHI67911.1 amino acid/amide ABC transporter ATP-binding protein 2, HAAT family [Geosporobacter subterraneus DSM 17957]